MKITSAINHYRKYLGKYGSESEASSQQLKRKCMRHCTLLPAILNMSCNIPSKEQRISASHQLKQARHQA